MLDAATYICSSQGKHNAMGWMHTVCCSCLPILPVWFGPSSCPLLEDGPAPLGLFLSDLLTSPLLPHCVLAITDLAMSCFLLHPDFCSRTSPPQPFLKIFWKHLHLALTSQIVICTNPHPQPNTFHLNTWLNSCWAMLQSHSSWLCRAFEWIAPI